MADKKISALNAASTPLAGSEVLPIVQGSSTVKVSVANLTVGRTVTANDLIARKAAGGELILDSTAAGTSNTISSVANNGGAFADLNYVANAHNWKIGATTLASTDANGTYKIFTLGTECLRVSINDVTNYKGNFVVGTAGKGIDFSANTSAPGMTSELLDWYEEGVWTPVVASSSGAITTVGAVSGTYTRIGRQVTIWASIEITDNGTGAGRIDFSGVPFASASTIRSVGHGWNASTAASLSAYVNTGVTNGSVWRYDAAYPVASGQTFSFCVTYNV